MTTGILGGTFDPIHCGHLDVAHAARRALELDQVWLMPARTPPHRRQPVASPEDRMAMTALAAQGQAGLSASDVEMETSGPSYTAHTLDRLQARGLDLASVFFITGADAFREIETWKNYPNILDRCHFVVVSRQGIPVSDLPERLPALARRMRTTPCEPVGQPSIFLVEAPTASVSSTAVRQAAACGLSLAGLVPEMVASYIDERGLYRGTQGQA